MESELILRKLVSELEFVNGLYDDIRLIDPLKKQVITCLKNKKDFEKTLETRKKCYSVLDRTMACENCVSTRAINNKKPIVKIEFANPNVYLITAVPIKQEESWYAIELFKDVTNDGIIDIEGKEVGEIRQLIERKNSTIVRDAFTRIFNDNYINSRLPHDIYKAHDESIKLALFLISIRNLKVINNLFGFQVGDGILKEYSKVIKNYSRKPDDWTARYGATEFIIVLHDVNATQAYRICKRINDKLCKIELLSKQKSTKIEFDIGFHILDGELLPAEEFILAAGENIYKEVDRPTGKKTAIASEILPKFLFTEREREVALLLLEGKSNIEIAQSLFIGISTVKKHIASIFNKTHVKTRSEFIAKVKEEK